MYTVLYVHTVFKKKKKGKQGKPFGAFADSMLGQSTPKKWN